MKPNFKTPIEEVLFRCYSIGTLAGGLERSELTAIQAEKVKTLTEKKDTPKGLTEKQEAELNKYIAKREAPPVLSVGAKSEIKKVWLRFEKEFIEEIKSKYTNKGLQSEEDAIKLLSFVDDVMYTKNEKRITKGNLTGECDIVKGDMIQDVKCSWNPEKFMNAGMTTLYEWQLRAYMYLYDKPKAMLRYCLVDCPPEVYNDELRKFCWNKNIFIDDNGNYPEKDLPLIEQFDKNYLYENTGRYTQEERVKSFSIERCPKKEKILLESIKLGIDFYKTITLNMI